MSSVIAPAREKTVCSLVFLHHYPLLIYDPNTAFTAKTGFVYACLYVLRVEKGKVVKTPEFRSCGFIWTPRAGY